MVQKADGLRRLAAGMIAAGFDGQTVPESLKPLLADGLGMAMLFARNVGPTPADVRRLCEQLKSAGDGNLILAADQEGGNVRRLDQGFTPVPSMRQIGQTGDETLARDAGRVLARECRAVGVDMNFAPVVDVDTNPANPVIGERSFGRDPQLVARFGVAALEAMQAEGVAACVKHFPGHGDTAQDSHWHQAVLNHDLERLRSVELVPFQAAVRAGVASVMTAHVIFTPLDREHPATLSPLVLKRLLREEMGYDGFVMSDDLEMRSVADRYSIPEIIERGIAAGVDLFLISLSFEKQVQAIDAIVEAVRSGRISEDVLHESARRREAVVKRFVGPARPELMEAPEHKALAQRVMEVGGRNGGSDPTDAGHA